MDTTTEILSKLGWRNFLQQQLTLEELDTSHPARVIEQQRSSYRLQLADQVITLEISSSMPKLVIGDWLLLADDHRFIRLLERFSLFKRRAAGEKSDVQLIAANIDTAFITSSLNEDFNLNRIERYLAVTHEAGAMPVVVLTKLDLCADPQSAIAAVQKLDPSLIVEAVNGLDPSGVDSLKTWCTQGQTVAFLGSSGVGKSTLVNALSHGEVAKAAAVRADNKGKHTTTERSMYLLADAGILIDTPGMRELQLADCDDGVAAVFDDITALAEACRFSDCQHQSEPGCAVQQAISEDQLDVRRLNNYLKLNREQAFNSASIAEKRAKSREIGRYHRNVQSESRSRKNKD